jgi:methylmalonyl-CoA decarboxylase subunit alpha
MSVHEELSQKREEIKQCQNPEYLKKMEKQGKMFVRDRLKLLLDPGFEIEDGIFARCLEEKLPADAVVTVVGKINGRTVCVMANDLTVKAGTWGIKTIEKIMRIQETALKLKVPMIYLVDSAGARLNEQFDTFLDRRHAGKIFYNQGIMSGVVPQICAVLGPSPAGSAYMPALCDIVIMVDQNTSVYIGSPRMAEMVTGEKVSMEEMGGAMMHCSESGLGDCLVSNEIEALEAVKSYLSYLPQNWKDSVPLSKGCLPEDGRDIEEIIPENQGITFDIKEVILRLIDKGTFFEFKERYAQELVTGFARLDGRSIGIIANRSTVKAGVLFPESSDKGAHFISMCNAYNVPLLFLMDISGFMIGSRVEKNAIARRGAKWLSFLFNATTPRISVMLRKAYGAGYVAMSGASSQSDYCIALPTALPAIMGPEAAINAMYLNKINEITDKKEQMKYIHQKRQEYLKDINCYRPASQLYIDDIVRGSVLREDLARRFNTLCENYHRPKQIEEKRNSILRG